MENNSIKNVAEERNDDLYASIDLIVDKLERQIRKNKTRLNRQNNENKLKEFKINSKYKVYLLYHILIASAN